MAVGQLAVVVHFLQWLDGGLVHLLQLFQCGLGSLDIYIYIETFDMVPHNSHFQGGKVVDCKIYWNLNVYKHDFSLVRL